MTRKSHGPGPFLDGAEAWRPGAACRSVDTGLFYPSAGWVGHEHHQAQIAKAKAVDINEADGVWGGTDPIEGVGEAFGSDGARGAHERRAILKRRKLAS